MGHVDLKHGLAEPEFRFSRMGPAGTGLQLGEATRVKLAAAMTAGSSLDGVIPSGFTYLGQFIDHDLTFDRTNVMFDTDVSPAQMLQGRSPTVDLDSLYGAGPNDPGSVKFYADDGVHLKTGDSMASGGEAAFPGHDLPRAGTGTAAAKRVAVIPDPRNDENLAVAQTHAMFIRFHNRVVDTLPATPAPLVFTRAREKVTRHHQWMIRHDFLPRICDSSILDDVFTNGRKVFEVGVDPTSMPTMPVEFSIAAYRLGHSMVRSAYNWNKDFDNHTGTLEYLFQFTALSGDLGGSPRLISIWVADFRRLYDFSEAGRADLVVPAGQVQPRPPHRHAAGAAAGHAASRGAAGAADQRRADQPRLPKPHPRVHGQTRHRPADGRAPQRAKASASPRSPRPRSATAPAAPTSARSPTPSARACSPTRRFGSTPCAKPNSTAAS